MLLAPPDDGEFVVQVFDHSFRLDVAAIGDERLRQAATDLDSRMRKLAARSRRCVTLELAILAALEIADEVLSAQQKREKLLAEAEECIGRFTQNLATGPADRSDPTPEEG